MLIANFFLASHKKVEKISCSKVRYTFYNLLIDGVASSLALEQRMQMHYNAMAIHMHFNAWQSHWICFYLHNRLSNAIALPWPLPLPRLNRLSIAVFLRCCRYGCKLVIFAFDIDSFRSIRQTGLFSSRQPNPQTHLKGNALHLIRKKGDKKKEIRISRE